MDIRRYYRKATALNAYMFIINDCTNFLLSDVSIINSSLWTVKLSDCDRVFVSRVYIFSDLEKGVNADGIDICSSRNITISGSMIVTADDSIVLKTIARNGKKANPCENITVTNCILSSSSTALMIGTETEADISNVLFNNCVFTFIHVRGDKSKDIILRNNDLGKAKGGITFEKEELRKMVEIK